MKTIKIEDVIAFAKFKRSIDKEKLTEITFTRNDMPIPIEKEDLDEWKYTGLCNYDFARYELLTDEENDAIG